MLLGQCQDVYSSIPGAAAQTDLQLALVALAEAHHGHVAFFLADALARARLACDRVTIANSLLTAARWAESLGLHDIGTQLLASSRQLSSDLGYVLGKWDREAADLLEQSLRHSLGEDGFAQVYSNGLTLGWKKAVECALALTEDEQQYRIRN